MRVLALSYVISCPNHSLDTFYGLQMYQQMLNQKIYPGEKMIITIFSFSFRHAFLKTEIIFYQKKLGREHGNIEKVTSLSNKQGKLK